MPTCYHGPEDRDGGECEGGAELPADHGDARLAESAAVDNAAEAVGYSEGSKVGEREEGLDLREQEEDKEHGGVLCEVCVATESAR